jgi:2-polyprenyl-3-methyl-5-hydroxy-6-metoxy-1,4-benzoquinol methylase
MEHTLKESHIRPEETRKIYWELLENEIKKYLDDENVLKKEFSRKINCPLCKSKRYKELFKKRGFCFVKCVSCDLVYLNPILESEMLEKFYNSDAMNYMQNKILKSTYAEMLKTIVPSGKLLEIGCSVGYFLDAAKEIGNWKLFGIEPNEKAARYVREQLNIKIFNDFADDLLLKEKFFDAIVSFEVIEHITNPTELIESCYRLLKNNGYLIMSTPNINGFDFKILKKYHRSYSPPGHCLYFTPQTFQSLLKRAGFREIIINTPGRLDVENVRNELMRTKNLPVKIDEFLKELLLSNDAEYKNARIEFQQFLAENGFSSHMIAICKK